jgi:hypothetical protein
MDDQYLELFQHVLTALKELAAQVEQLEARVRLLEK